MKSDVMGFEKLDYALSSDFSQIVLGMDDLYRSENQKSGEQSLDKEGLVPINLTKETPKKYLEFESVISDLEDLRESYLAVESDVRRNYMQQQIGSLIGLAKWCRGDSIPFREKVRDLLYVNENPLVETERMTLHQQLDTALSKRGLNGTLVEKFNKWQDAQLVPANQIESVLKDLLAEAKQRVVETMFPVMEDVEVTPVVLTGVPYSAYCDYVGGKMYINGDLTYTYEALKHLVAHEAFPGHTTHMRIRELGVQSGNIPLDAGLVITNTASSSVFEGIGDNGMRFIKWMDTIDDDINDVYQKIRSVSGLNTAHMIHAEHKTADEVRLFLKEFAFGEENWINSRLRFFKHSLRAPFIYAYYRGFEAVNSVYEKLEPNDQSAFFNFLYKNMLSADTVKQFG